MTMQPPKFPPKISLPVSNLKTGLPYRLIRIDQLEAIPENISSIASICNEPLVYNLIFRDILGGKPYPLAKAKDFFTWGARGWSDGTHFVFIVVTFSEGGDSPSRIVAAADIKSADPAQAEIGYWASAEHSGVMRPTIAAMCELARAAGYRSLFARVKHGNDRSMAVLKHCNFAECADEETATHSMWRRVNLADS